MLSMVPCVPAHLIPILNILLVTAIVPILEMRAVHLERSKFYAQRY